MPQPLDVINQFGSDIFFKFIAELIHSAGEHEILPYHQTQLVAQVIKIIAGIAAAAPYPDGVEVGRHTIL